MAARRSDKKAGSSPDAGRAPRTGDDREFVAEAEEILDRLLEGLSELAEQCLADDPVDPELVNRLFRAAHSLKGLAGMFGLDAISSLSHRMEDVLDGLRLGRVPLDPHVVGLLEEGVTLLASRMAGLPHAESVDDDEQTEQLGCYVDRIDALLATAEAAPGDALEALDLDPAVLRALTEYEEHRLRESLHRGRELALVDSTFELAAFEEGLSALTATIRELGELVSTLPSAGAAPESQIRFSLLVATELDAPQLARRLGLEPGDVVAIASGRPGARARLPAESDPSAEGREIESLRSISETVRVDIRKLDELMNLVGELAIQRNAIGEIAQRLCLRTETARVGAELVKAHKTLERKLKELQTGVLDVRMVPMRQIFEKLSRVVRRLRRDLGKSVVFDFEGAETELDKLIVERLVDPLVHIVRNAFDHALEDAPERLAAGKPERGRIRVSAFARGNHVVVEVADDGRGMDLGAIRSKAIEAGLIASDETLTDKEVLNLIFEAGLSTADTISETSGRGVGMDVVRSNLSELGGIVDLVSTPGEGTCVTITLPITLAIIQALIVGIGDERFAIPLSSVLETLVIEPDEIGRIEDREILDLRGEPLLLRRLGEEFELASAGRDERQFVVVLGIGEQRLGLLVDRLEGQQDTVIKPIKGPLQPIRGIAGATELGEGGAILVIDVSAILGDALRRREAA